MKTTTLTVSKIQIGDLIDFGAGFGTVVQKLRGKDAPPVGRWGNSTYFIELSSGEKRLMAGNRKVAVKG